MTPRYYAIELTPEEIEALLAACQYAKDEGTAEPDLETAEAKLRAFHSPD